MRLPNDRCLFCFSEEGPFTRDEHPIPESLGNDELVIPPGFVCDPCNQYFGSKIEQPVLSLAPFALERVSLNIASKKGRVPTFSDGINYTLYPTGFRDTVVFTGQPLILNAAMVGHVIPVLRAPNEEWLIARFLLKMGLELMLLTDDIDPYSPQFDQARNFVRVPSKRDAWQYAVGRYPRRHDLINHKTERNGELWINEQLYQYSAGVMSTGEVGFAFLYRDHYFAINLNTPECERYVRQFDLLNEFKLTVIWAKYSK